MSTRRPAPDATTRTFHLRALAALGALVCITMLSVARDLRSGAIVPEDYDQRSYGIDCGSACCIAGHVAFRLKKRVDPWLRSIGFDPNSRRPQEIIGLVGHNGCLFGANHPSNPQQAARAIERYLYEGAKQPWAGPL